MRYFLSLTVFAASLIFHISDSYGIGGSSGFNLEGAFDVQEANQDYLKKGRVGSSFFLADMDSAALSSPGSMLSGKSDFLGVVLEEMASEEFRGKKIVKSQQKYKGLNVFGGEVVTRKDEASAIQMGFAFGGIDVNVKPKISKNDAISILKKKFGDHIEIEEIKLGILPTPSGKKLAYKSSLIRSLSENYIVYIDAQNGKILRAFNTVDSLNAWGLATKNGGKAYNLFSASQGVTSAKENNISLARGTGLNLKNKKVPLMLGKLEGHGFALLDPNKKIFTFDARGGPNYDVFGIISPNNKEDDAVFVASKDPNIWNNKPGVTAHYHSTLVFDFMKEQFNRNSIDGKGSPVVSVVNAVQITKNGKSLDNAFYNGSYMIYLVGSWNGKTGMFTNWAGSLDVTAHELAHGITRHTSGLEYQGESGALSESFSDMVGVSVEYFKDNDSFDWAVGEDIIAPTNKYYEGGLRFLDDPKRRKHPDTYKGKNWYSGKGDNGGVHTNSGVGNKAFYLMANGGTHNGVKIKGLGVGKAIKVAYRANSVYLTSRSQYVDAAKGFILAAKDLYSEQDAYNVYLAWKAVNLEIKDMFKKGAPEDTGTPQREPEPAPVPREQPEPQKSPAPKPKSDDGFLGGDMGY